MPERPRPTTEFQMPQDAEGARRFLEALGEIIEPLSDLQSRDRVDAPEDEARETVSAK